MPRKDDADDLPTTGELHVEQIRRERAERSAAEQSLDPLEERTHERRAERAAYLKDKLEEQAEALDE